MRFAFFLLLLPPAFSQAPYLQVRTLAGSDRIGDGGPATSALFLNLNGVAVDPLGNLYLADTDAHRIRRIAPNGLTTTFAGTGRPGYSGDGGPASEAAINLPYGVATDYAGSVYIADLGNARIRKVAPDGVISTVAGHTPETRLLAPRNVAVDGPGRVFVADFNGHRVYRLSPVTGLIPVAGSGRPGFAGDNGPAAAALLNSPAGLAIDPAGNLYIGDTGNKAVRRVDAVTGVISSIPEGQMPPLVATGLAYSFAGDLWAADGNGGTVMRLPAQASTRAVALPFAARDVAVDFSANAFTAQGNAVRRINRTNGAVTLHAGGNPYYFAGDGGDAASARLHQPRGLAFDRGGGALYLADSRNARVRRVSAATGRIETVIDSIALSNPQGLCWDAPRDTLYIADAGNHTVWVWTRGARFARSFAGDGFSGFSGDNGAALDAKLSAPTGVAVDDRGNVWIADTGNGRIRLVAPDGRIRTVTSLIPGPASIVWDARGGFAYVASPAANSVYRLTSAGTPEPLPDPGGIWREPAALAIDSDGSLLVADTATNRVTRWTSGGRIALVAGAGEAGFDGDRPLAAVSARLDGPLGLAVDGSGRILIADANNHRVRILEPAEAAGSLTETPSWVTVRNAASGEPAPAVAPGGLFTLSGADPSLEPAFDGMTPPYGFLKNGEWTVQAPEDLVPGRETELTLTRNGVVLSRQMVKVTAAAPGVFAPIVNAATGSPNGPADPVGRGEPLLLRITGEGRADLPLRIRIRGADAAILSVRPGDPGVLTVEVQAPGGFFPAGTFPLTVDVGGMMAQSGLTVSIR